MDVTVVTGVPGVGASLVCQETRKRLGAGFELINFGDAMLEQAVARGSVESRDDMATLPLRELELLQRRAGEYVATRARNRSIILNTHLAVGTVHGFIPGLPGDVLRDVDPDRFVLVEADPGTIANRRDSVETREYREEGPRSIELHQDLNRAAAMNCSVESYAPVRLVENTGDVDDAASTLATIVSEADRSD
ncbi:MAG: adenylate kinase [Natronomonas sp.]